MQARLLLRCIPSVSQSASRGALRPARNLPFRGIYRTENEVCKQGDILVCQGNMDYHPGLNVVYEFDRRELLLKAACDGVVKISREKVKPDFSRKEMAVYEHRKDTDIYKLHFNVIPFEPSNRYALQSEI